MNNQAGGDSRPNVSRTEENDWTDEGSEGNQQKDWSIGKNQKKR